jgi:hypothetical protein
MTEGDDAGVWLTKAEFAARRQISQASADRLIRRQGWRRQPGNDGRVRVLVPEGALGGRESRPPEGYPREATPEGNDPIETILAALREAHAGEISRLTEALARAEQATAAERARIDALIVSSNGLRDQIATIEAKLAAETARADEAEQVREAARKRAHELANRAMALEGAADRAEAEADALRTEVTLIQATKLATAEQAHAAAQAAQERLDAMRRADAERRGQGRWARLRAAWRGE